MKMDVKQSRKPLQSHRIRIRIQSLYDRSRLFCSKNKKPTLEILTVRINKPCRTCFFLNLHVKDAEAPVKSPPTNKKVLLVYLLDSKDPHSDPQ